MTYPTTIGDGVAIIGWAAFGGDIPSPYFREFAAAEAAGAHAYAEAMGAACSAVVDVVGPTPADIDAIMDAEDDEDLDICDGCASDIAPDRDAGEGWNHVDPIWDDGHTIKPMVAQ
jgi:hypothetical protein